MPGLKIRSLRGEYSWGLPGAFAITHSAVSLALMTPRDREKFDRVLEKVLADLPSAVHQILEEVPLIVEDRPSAEIMREMEVTEPDELCGLYDGVPLSEPEVRPHRLQPDGILIFREGILSSATDETGHVDRDELREQIRITILHEVGHHHGMTEEDLDELGYG
jgi:predicted Zn-dependent protease with MMP-like domain